MSAQIATITRIPSKLSSWSSVTRYVAIAALALLALQIVLVAANPSWYQYDFRAYALAPRLWLDGHNPYSGTALEQLAQQLRLGENTHPFLYPPHMLWVFLPLGLVPYPVAYYCWLSLQCAGLLVIYRTTSRFGVDRAWLLLVMAIGANGAFASCLRSGQVSLFTAAGVYLALFCLLRDRISGFLAWGVAIAIPKLWPLPLLVLGLFKGLERRSLLLVFQVSAVLLIVPLLLLAERQFAQVHWNEFSQAATQLSGLARLNPDGPMNGSLLNVIQSLAPGQTGLIAYGVIALAMVGAMTHILLTSARQRRPMSIMVVWSVLLGLGVLMPRLMTYQWVVFLPAMAHVIQLAKGRWLKLSLATPLLIPTVYINRYLLQLAPENPVSGVGLTLWSFLSTFSLVGCWIVAISIAHQSLKTNQDNSIFATVPLSPEVTA